MKRLGLVGILSFRLADAGDSGDPDFLAFVNSDRLEQLNPGMRKRLQLQEDLLLEQVRGSLVYQVYQSKIQEELTLKFTTANRGATCVADEGKSIPPQTVYSPGTVHALRVHQQTYNQRADLNRTQLAALNICERWIFKLELLRDFKAAERDLKLQLRKEGFSKLEIQRQLELPRLIHRKNLLEKELQQHFPYFGSSILSFLNNPIRHHRAVSKGHAVKINQELKMIDLKLGLTRIVWNNPCSIKDY